MFSRKRGLRNGTKPGTELAWAGELGRRCYGSSLLAPAPLRGQPRVLQPLSGIQKVLLDLEAVMGVPLVPQKYVEKEVGKT